MSLSFLLSFFFCIVFVSELESPPISTLQLGNPLIVKTTTTTATTITGNWDTGKGGESVEGEGYEHHSIWWRVSATEQATSTCFRAWYVSLLSASPTKTKTLFPRKLCSRALQSSKLSQKIMRRLKKFLAAEFSVTLVVRGDGYATWDQMWSSRRVVLAPSWSIFSLTKDNWQERRSHVTTPATHQPKSLHFVIFTCSFQDPRSYPDPCGNRWSKLPRRYA